MKDRLPGAPGRHIAVVDADQLQKMQKAEPFAITLTRDDQPTEPGTPYSKAAVLPDDVAEKLCAGVEDPTPADAFRYIGNAQLGSSREAFAAFVSSFDGYKDTNGDLIQRPGCKVYRLMMGDNEKLYGKTVRIKTYAYGNMVYGWNDHGQYIPINPNADIEENPRSGVREFEVTFPEYNANDLYEIFDVSFCENPYTDFAIYEKKGTIWEELKKLQSVEGYDAFESVLTAVKYEKQLLTEEQKAQARENVGFVPAVEDTIDSVAYKYNSLVNSALGTKISANDTLDKKLLGLNLYGKTTQDGPPTPDSPVELVSVGDNGSFAVSVTDGTGENVQTLTVQTSNGLRGIQVIKGNNHYPFPCNYDNWICDEIDYARGVRIQRIGKCVIDGSIAPIEFYATANSGNGSVIGWLYEALGMNILASPTASKISPKLCDKLQANPARYSSVNMVDFGYWGSNTYSGSDKYLFINVGKFATKEDALAYLHANKVTFYYLLNEPIEIPLTEHELTAYKILHTNKSNTTVTNDGGAGMAISYVADTKAYIDNKFTQLQNAILSAGANV